MRAYASSWPGWKRQLASGAGSSILALCDEGSAQALADALDRAAAAVRLAGAARQVGLA